MTSVYGRATKCRLVIKFSIHPETQGRETEHHSARTPWIRQCALSLLGYNVMTSDHQ